MGRTLMYTALGALLLLVLSSVFLLEHGGARIPAVGSQGAVDPSADPVTVSLHDLTSSGGIQKYAGRAVSTSGTLYYNSATNKFVIIDGNQNYPVTIDSPRKLGQFEGKQVLVTGTFNAIDGAGPTIAATSVELDGSPTPTPKDI